MLNLERCSFQFITLYAQPTSDLINERETHIFRIFCTINLRQQKRNSLWHGIIGKKFFPKSMSCIFQHRTWKISCRLFAISLFLHITLETAFSSFFSDFEELGVIFDLHEARDT